MASEHSEKGNILVTAAKVLGSAAGKIASLAHAEGTPANAPVQNLPEKSGKFQARHKSRLPRKVKKLRKKAEALRASTKLTS